MTKEKSNKEIPKRPREYSNKDTKQIVPNPNSKGKKQDENNQREKKNQ